MHFNDFRHHVATAAGTTSQIPDECPGVQGAEPPCGRSRFEVRNDDFPLTYNGEPEPDASPRRLLRLDTQETSDTPPPSTFVGDFEKFWHFKNDFKEQPDVPLLDEETQSARFRHAGWAPIRRRVFAALERTGQSAARRTAFGCCGSFSYVEQSDCAPFAYRLRSNQCKDRLCTPCANARSALIARKLLSLLPAGSRSVSFITLTLCGKGESLQVLVDRIYRHFKALRQHPLWQESVTAGAAFLEIKWNDKAQRWHPHLHLICLAKFIDKQALSDVWRGISKDSFIVDVRRVQDQQIVGSYACKYASKPLNSSFSNTPRLLDEALLALKGRRLCFTFGEWYGEPLTGEDDDDIDPASVGTWHFIAPLDELLSRATAADPNAVEILRSAGLEVLWRGNVLSTPPPPPH